MAGSTTTLLWGLLTFQEGYSASGQLERMREVARWPLDYFLKCWDAGNKILYGQVRTNTLQDVEFCVSYNYVLLKG